MHARKNINPSSLYFFLSSSSAHSPLSVHPSLFPLRALSSHTPSGVRSILSILNNTTRSYRCGDLLLSAICISHSLRRQRHGGSAARIVAGWKRVKSQYSRNISRRQLSRAARGRDTLNAPVLSLSLSLSLLKSATTRGYGRGR